MMPDASPKPASAWKRYVWRSVAGRLSSITRYYDRVLHWLPKDDDGLLLEELDSPLKVRIPGGEPLPDCSQETDRRTAILVAGALNYSLDIQSLLEELAAKMSRTSRLLLVLHNPYHRWLYSLATKLGLRHGEVPKTFITRVDLENLARLSGFALVRQEPQIYVPFRLLGVGDLVNKIVPMIPLVRWLSWTYLVVMRPVKQEPMKGLSCVIPARNEKGNIENALRRFPDLGGPTEIIFVEGHSGDGTWQEIQRVAEAYGSQFRIKCFQQTGKGKADAVRLGFSHAGEHLLTVLDADLTVPPEDLKRFVRAYCDGHGDFINGSRLVYPMEDDAMRFLNQLGNVFFAGLLSKVLGVRLGDSLCGTKLMARHDYERMIQWRKDFGDFDPFGDFEILFPAATLCLDMLDVPIRYKAREYGSTQISRFRDGAKLLRMCLVGFWRIKLGMGRRPAKLDHR